MLYKRILLFVLMILFIANNKATLLGITDPKDVFDFVQKVFCTYNQIKDEVKTWKDAVGVTMNFFESFANQQKKLLDQLANKLNSLSEQVHVLQDVAGTKLNRLESLLTQLPTVLLQSDLTNDIAKSLRFIDNQHNLFLEYSSSNKFNNITLSSFSKSVTDSGKNGVRSHLDEIFGTVGLNSRVKVGDTILKLINKQPQQNEVDSCEYTRPTQQSLFDLYNTLISTEMNGFIVITYAYSLQTMFHGVSVEQEMKSTEKSTLDRVEQYHKAFTAAVRSMPRSFGACETGDINSIQRN